MKDSLVARLNRLIDRGTNLYVDGTDVRTHAEGKDWQGHADQFKQEAKAWVKEQSPADAVRLESLSPYPAVTVPPGNPWWTSVSVLDVIASCTSSVKCETNSPVSYHLALVNELKEIARDWRVKLPGAKTGPKPIKLDKQKSTAKYLLNSGMAKSKSNAARLSVAQHGIGGCASKDAAIATVRKSI